jgi:tetratricopeptide (TPR) repeat protein
VQVDSCDLHYNYYAITCKQLLGPAHPFTATSLSNLGSNLDNQGRHTEAEPLHRQALAELETALGATQAHTAWALFQLAQHLHALGETETARVMAQQAQAALLKQRGPKHRRSRRVATWLAGHSSLPRREIIL